MDRESSSSKDNSRALPLLWETAQCSYIGPQILPNLQESVITTSCSTTELFFFLKISPKGLVQVNWNSIRPSQSALEQLTFPYFRLRVCSDTAPSENTDWTSACQHHLRKQGPQGFPVPPAAGCHQRRALATSQAGPALAVLPMPLGNSARVRALEGYTDKVSFLQIVPHRKLIFC